MTVQQLRKLLRRYPATMRVMVNGENEDADDCNEVKEVRVRLNCHEKQARTGMHQFVDRDNFRYVAPKNRNNLVVDAIIITQ